MPNHLSTISTNIKHELSGYVSDGSHSITPITSRSQLITVLKHELAAIWITQP